MDAPQSRVEIDPIEAAIRALDEQLRIRWNPRSYITVPGGFDVYGNAIRPHYDGRWEVIRLVGRQDGAREVGEEQYVVVYQVRWDGEGLERYRPVGWWLVEFLRTWDRQNVLWMEEQKRMLDEEERATRHRDTQENEELEESLSRHGRDELHMEQWMGRGFGGGLRTVDKHSTSGQAV